MIEFERVERENKQKMRNQVDTSKSLTHVFPGWYKNRLSANLRTDKLMNSAFKHVL